MSRLVVSVIIKALNEEKHIARAIESALRAVSTVGGEVILADSASTDRTVEIASAYPITIASLGNPHERCCGIGAQLGYQHARGEFIYVLDGDMVMHAGFLEAALACFVGDATLAGVGGMVCEKNLDSLEYRMRVARASPDLQPGEVGRLDGGALYRRAAVERLGYLTDRNLHSYEEFDLGIRLRAAGWTLQRIPVNAVDHYGHTTEAVKLLLRRWKTGYICGSGEILRAAMGKSHLPLVLRELRDLHLSMAVIAWLLALIGVWWLPVALLPTIGAFVLVLVLPLLLMAVKKRSLTRAAYSIFSWCIGTAGLLRGLSASRRPPTESIQVRLRSPEVS